MTSTFDEALELAARAFEPPRRRWPSPLTMAMQLDRGVRTSPALDLIDVALVDLDGPDGRQMIFMPPQEGKSQLVSRRYPAWLLANDPTLRVAIVSYEAGKAERWGRQIRRDLRTHPQLGIDLMPDSQAAGRWETTRGGGLVCAGLQGGITGEPVDVLIIDDPVRGRAEAESVTYRDAAWEWWESNGSTRLSERGRVVLMMTRWHEDDLAGRMLAREGADWEVVSIPAISEGAGDPLDRPAGVELPSVRGRQPGYFHKLEQTRSGYVWRSIYQQNPTAAEGNLFKRADWRYWTPAADGCVRLDSDASLPALADMTRFITIDLATSKRTQADFTVAAAWGVTPSGDLLLLDRVRARVEEAGHFDLVTPLRQRWLGPYDVVYVESRMFGTTLVYAAGRAGLPLAELEADVDKLTRALPAAGLVRQHRVWLPRDAAWLDEWLDEHAEFPNATHDDQVDNTAYAARVLLAHWVPRQLPADVEAERGRLLSPPGLDLMTVQY